MVLVDTNAILDVLTDDPQWKVWSQEQLALAAPQGLAINPIIYAEIAPAFLEESELQATMRKWPLTWLPLPYAAAWRASQAFFSYRQRGGSRTAPLPDFFIGAHAETEGHTILTRDPLRYRSYFPGVPLIAP